MHLPNSRGQQEHVEIFDASGTSAAGTKLIIPQHKARSHLVIMNISDTAMYIEFGSARGTCAITSGAVTSATVTNGGFGFTRAPRVHFFGGGNGGNSSTIGCGQPDYPSPGDGGYAPPRTDMSGQRRARGHATLSGGVVNAIVIDDPGAGYAAAPFVFLSNDELDPFGCADPFFSSTFSGLYLSANGGSYFLNGTICTTDPISVYCASSGKAFSCKWTR